MLVPKFTHPPSLSAESSQDTDTIICQGRAKSVIVPLNRQSLATSEMLDNLLHTFPNFDTSAATDQQCKQNNVG